MFAPDSQDIIKLSVQGYQNVSLTVVSSKFETEYNVTFVAQPAITIGLIDVKSVNISQAGFVSTVNSANISHSGTFTFTPFYNQSYVSIAYNGLQIISQKLINNDVTA